MSSVNWAPLRSVIENSQSFLISSHVRPDADALGSELGMAAILRDMGKECTIVNATAPPANLSFLNPDQRILKLGADVASADLPNVDVHLVVDTSAWQQLGAMADVIQKAGKKRVVIDHHVSSDNMGAMEFKDVCSAATGELIFEAAEYLGVTFDSETASAIYRGHRDGYRLVPLSINVCQHNANCRCVDGTRGTASPFVQSAV